MTSESKDTGGFERGLQQCPECPRRGIPDRISRRLHRSGKTMASRQERCARRGCRISPPRSGVCKFSSGAARRRSGQPVPWRVRCKGRAMFAMLDQGCFSSANRIYRTGFLPAMELAVARFRGFLPAMCEVGSAQDQRGITAPGLVERTGNLVHPDRHCREFAWWAPRQISHLQAFLP